MINNSIDPKKSKSSSGKQKPTISSSKSKTVKDKIHQCESFVHAVSDVIFSFVQRRKGHTKKSTLYKHLNQKTPSKFTRYEIRAAIDLLLDRKLINCIRCGMGWIIYLISPKK